MTIQNLKNTACRGAALIACALAIPALAQTTGGRGGGGGGGGGGGNFGGGAGGGGGRASTASTATTSAIDRPGNGQIGSANFFVDKDTGQVIAIGDEQTLQSLGTVVASLAKPKPQVLIKVVFLEATYNKGYDVGIEGGVTKNINASTSLSASNLFGLASQGVTPTAGVNSLPGAGLYTVAGNNWEATVRAIAENAHVEVLSRPTILARHNQMATIQVGQNVPLITGVNFGALGNQENAISYSPVGIILNVTPFIGSDGTVEMILNPQISAVNPTLSQAISYTTNGTAITAPYIDIESANTVVATPDGQTVVIGGLMKNTKSDTDSKIPLLGDIPGLGALFHHKVHYIAKQELIIMLTPYVVRTPADLARMSSDERGRTEMAPKAFSEKELNRYLEGGKPTLAPEPAPPVAIPPR